MQRIILTYAIGAILLLANVQQTHAQIKAFPQAEGFGASATGGRGGDVYHVTNLTDSGLGSLRYGLDNAPTNGRTIVFDVSGWITLTSKLGMTKNRVTIAGQTAPGGVGIRNGQFSNGGDDVIVRHMRFRPGKITNTDHDSINTNENAQRVIYDHISAEFSTDGGFDLQADLVTLQYSSVSFGLRTHSTGGLIQAPGGGAAGELSFHHNMFAHNDTRNPKARAELIDWRDNVVYNYHNGFLAGESETDVNPNWRANFDGNTYISNIGSQPGGSGGRPMMTGGRTQNYDLWYGSNALDRDSDTVYDPIVYSKAQAQSNQQVVSSQYNWFDNPFPVGQAEVWQNASPAEAYQRVLAEFGATPWARDAVNQLIHTHVTTHTGTRISNENTLPIANAGYPNLNPGNLTAPTDTDSDGMPDAWEAKHGTNPAVTSNNADFDSDGYTDLEEYLNDLGAFKAIGALEFDGSGRYADWANWTRRWEPSRLDEVQINNGIATVDAVGQKAAIVNIGAATGSGGTLRVTNGWLEVTDNLAVGTTQAGIVNHEGGTVRVLGPDGVHIHAGTYNLSGGLLDTPRLTKNAAGSMSFTDGTLSADVVEFDLVNDGGVISPGNSPGTTQVMGDLTMNSGSLLMEVAGTSASQYDQLIVDGTLQAGGTLKVQFIDGYVPQAGDEFALLEVAAMQGSFNFDLPDLGGDLSWDTSTLATAGSLQIVSIPEPGTLVFCTFAMLAYACRR